MIEMDLVLFSSGSLLRTSIALREDLSPAARCEVSRTSPHRLSGGLRAVRRSKGSIPANAPISGISDASLTPRDSAQLLRIESP